MIGVSFYRCLMGHVCHLTGVSWDRCVICNLYVMSDRTHTLKKTFINPSGGGRHHEGGGCAGSQGAPTQGPGAAQGGEQEEQEKLTHLSQAFSSRCTHYGAPLVKGHLEGGQIRCMNSQSKISRRTWHV